MNKRIKSLIDLACDEAASDNERRNSALAACKLIKQSNFSTDNNVKELIKCYTLIIEYQHQINILKKTIKIQKDTIEELTPKSTFNIFIKVLKETPQITLPLIIVILASLLPLFLQ